MECVFQAFLQKLFREEGLKEREGEREREREGAQGDNVTAKKRLEESMTARTQDGARGEGTTRCGKLGGWRGRRRWSKNGMTLERLPMEETMQFQEMGEAMKRKKETERYSDGGRRKVAAQVGEMRREVSELNMEKIKEECKRQTA